MKSLVPLALLAALSTAAVQADVPVEGRDYLRLNPVQPTSDPARIVVTQYFNYQCPHCYAFEKPYSAWSARLPADVKAERAAVAIGHASWTATAQAYYALRAMNAGPRIDEALFGAIHRERRNLADETALANWLGGQGVDRSAFEKIYRSFSVQLQTRRADEWSRRLGLPSVPSLVIDGRYLIAIADDGNFKDQLDLADALIERVRLERAAVRGPSAAATGHGISP